MTSEWRSQGLLPPYRPSAERCLVPVEEFDPGPQVTDPNIAFSFLLAAEQSPGNPFSTTAMPEGGHDLSLIARIPSGPIREIVAACIDRAPVRLVYAAKTGGQEFDFSPSALVRSRGRYHLRGYRANGRAARRERLEDRYVDVIPARAIEAWRAVDTPFVGLEGDDDWNTFERDQYVLSSELSDEKRLCYEHEYGISESGALKVRQRRALIAYVRQELSERRCWRRDGTSVPVWDRVRRV